MINKLINMNIEIGQVLYKWNLQKMIVTRIGKKYFYVKDSYSKEYPIEKNSLTYLSKDYPQHNFQLYISEQEILSKKEHTNLCSKLYKYFISNETANCSLEKLKQIIEILKLN